MKRLLVIAATTALVAAWAPSAGAQAGPSASLGGVTNNATVTGYVNLVAKGSATTGVKRLEIQQNGSTIRSENYGGVQTSVSLPHTWDTRRLANTAYTLRARVTSNSDSSAAAEVRVLVNNPASSPTGVSASFTGDSVVVSWNPNPEPDVSAYVVERDSGGGWTTVGSTSSTSLSDSPGGGNHSYRVIAVRPSPTGGQNTSAPSGGASVSVPQSSSGSSGGTGGGSGSGSAGGGKGGGSGGNKVAGYGGGSKGSKKGKGAGSRAGGGFYGGFGIAGGRRLGSLGLPGRLHLPGHAGAARAEIAQFDDSGWGEFGENLPYNLPDGIEVTEQVPGGLDRIAAVSPWRVIPPDGLRWVAAGLWLIVTAMLLLFLERRLAASQDEAVREIRGPAAPSIDVIALNISAHEDTESRHTDHVALNMSAQEHAELRFVDKVALNMAPAETPFTKTPEKRSSTPPRRTAVTAGRKKATTRTRTVKRTAKKQTAEQRLANRSGSASEAPPPARRRPAPRSAKTTTARKVTGRTGARRSGARKTKAADRPLRLVKEDAAA